MFCFVRAVRGRKKALLEAGEVLRETVAGEFVPMRLEPVLVFTGGGMEPRKNKRRCGLAMAKFKVGQAVDFNPVRTAVPASIREYKIVRLMPRDHGEQEYRIKSNAELFERIAKESELSKR